MQAWVWCGKFDVVDKAAAAGEEAHVLDAAHRLADAIGLHGKVAAHVVLPRFYCVVAECCQS